MSLLWTLNSSLPGTLWADTGKTVAITDGTGVAAVVPAAGSITTDAQQATSGSRPTYRANYSSSGYPALEFDGTADHLAISHSSNWNVSILDVFAVVTLNSLGFRGIIGKWTNSSWNDGWGVCTDTVGFVFGAPTYTNGSARYTAATRILIYAHFQSVWNWGRFGDYYGGGVIGAGPANNTASVHIGRADPSGAYFLSGAMNELRVYGGGETDAALTAIRTEMLAAWGLTPDVAGGIPIARGMHGGMR